MIFRILPAAAICLLLCRRQSKQALRKDVAERQQSMQEIKDVLKAAAQ